MGLEAELLIANDAEIGVLRDLRQLAETKAYGKRFWAVTLTREADECRFLRRKRNMPADSPAPDHPERVIEQLVSDGAVFRRPNSYIISKQGNSNTRTTRNIIDKHKKEKWT